MDDFTALTTSTEASLKDNSAKGLYTIITKEPFSSTR